MERIKEIGVSKSTIYFKIKLVKVLDKYQKIETSSALLNLFKDYLKRLFSIFFLNDKVEITRVSHHRKKLHRITYKKYLFGFISC